MRSKVADLGWSVGPEEGVCGVEDESCSGPEDPCWEAFLVRTMDGTGEPTDAGWSESLMPPWSTAGRCVGVTGGRASERSLRLLMPVVAGDAG